MREKVETTMNDDPVPPSDERPPEPAEADAKAVRKAEKKKQKQMTRAAEQRERAFRGRQRRR